MKKVNVKQCRKEMPKYLMAKKNNHKWIFSKLDESKYSMHSLHLDNSEDMELPIDRLNPKVAHWELTEEEYNNIMIMEKL